MQFLKAHYEKIILSVVLLGLAAAAALMPMKVSQERQKADERNTILVRPKVKPFPKVEMTNELAILTRVNQDVKLQYGGNHNIFNPVRWQKRPDGGLLKGSETGVQALQVTNIVPLRYRLSFDGLAPGENDPVRYQLSVLREVNRNSRPTPRIAGVKDKNREFTIQEVIGDPKAPSGLKVLIEGDKEPVTITPDKPIERIIGYAADFRYDPENRNWRELKVKDELSFGGETYNIVAITAREVVVSAKSNKKQTTLELKAAPK